MWQTTLAQVRAHAGRLIASCLAIVIAVGFDQVFARVLRVQGDEVVNFVRHLVFAGFDVVVGFVVLVH